MREHVVERVLQRGSERRALQHRWSPLHVEQALLSISAPNQQRKQYDCNRQINRSDDRKRLLKP